MMLKITTRGLFKDQSDSLFPVTFEFVFITESESNLSYVILKRFFYLENFVHEKTLLYRYILQQKNAGKQINARI